jgi:hypothetical protein
VSSPQIGVHLADHSFFPIFESETGRKRILLSTSHKDQECVDIVLYRRDAAFPEGEERLGHVLLCDIAGGTPEESDIELILDLHEDGRIEATALDRRSGNSKTVAIDRSEAMPEYQEDDQFAAGSVEALYGDDAPEAVPTRERTGRGLLWLLLVLILLLLGVLAWWFFFNSSDGDASAMDAPPETVAPADDSDREPAEPEPAEPEPAEPEPVAPAPDDSDAGTTEDTLPQNGSGTFAPEDYQIKWGDTLWDISKMFYGTPWRFPELARENLISDPDRIYADDSIRIPGK